MQVSDWIAVAALLVSVIAALYAWRSAVYAKQQADAAIGNLPPDVEMRARVKSEGGMGRPLRIRVVNHNREQALVLGFDFKAPDDVKIFRNPVKIEAEPPRLITLPYPVAVKPHREDPNATAFDFTFVTDPANVAGGAKAEIQCEVRFRIGNSRKEVRRYCFQEVER